MDPKALKQIEEILNKSLHAQEERLSNQFATKDDLKNFATKDDVKNLATKDDLKNLATKDDVHQLDKKIDKVDDVMWAIFRSVDKMKSDKSELNRLEDRVEQLEQKIVA